MYHTYNDRLINGILIKRSHENIFAAYLHQCYVFYWPSSRINVSSKESSGSYMLWIQKLYCMFKL